MGVPSRLRSWPVQLALILAVVVVARVPFLMIPPTPDEAGFYQVGRSWALGGTNLYGHYWVDRPPGLIALFAIAGLLGRWWVMRVVAVGFALAFVYAASAAARAAGGSRRWAAVAAAALVVTPAIDAQLATGELLAVPFVMGSVALTLLAVRRRGRAAFLLAVPSGLAAALAMSVKQNFAGGFAFALILVVGLVLRRELRKRDAAAVLAGGFLGAGLVAALMLLVGIDSARGIPGLWFAVVEFRVLADAVVATHSTLAPMLRARGLVTVAVLSGIIPIVGILLVQAGRARLRGGAVSWAIGLTLVVDILAIVGGGSYWLHYLIQPAPMLALALGRWAPRWRVLRLAGVLTVVSAVVATLTTGAVAATHDVDPDQTGRWVARAAQPGDTATMLFGHADAQLATGLPSPYPYLWTLPMRTLDPHVAQLSALLRGPHAPTWVIGWNTLDPWKIDAHGALTRALAQHYRLVRMICGHHVWLRDGVGRSLPPDPSCAHRVRLSQP